MQRNAFTITLMVMLFPLSAVPTFAQTTTLTLEQVMQIALEKNATVQQAENNIQLAQSAVLSASGTYLPTLDTSGSWNRSQRSQTGVQLVGDQVVPSSLVSNQFSMNVGLQYVLFNDFGREAGLSQAKAIESSTALSYDRTRQTIVFQAESDYMNVLRTETLVKVSDENLKRDQRE